MITLEEAKAQGPFEAPYCMATKPGRARHWAAFTCTLAEDHDGIHVAHGPGSEVMAAWADDDKKATEL